MMSYSCPRPEWADDDPCPIDTGEVDDCKECEWYKDEDQ